jgi:protocatechuate 3,4-dioxygenase beta subunit
MTTATAFRTRYPGPWTIEESAESVRVVARDGTLLAHIYFEDEIPSRQRITNRVTRAEAHALAKAIASLADPA